MAITLGMRIGSYEVIGGIGAGGMGEVYRARDTRLNRDVALKILPEAFASDPERLARFEREAQVLASLNHPNIAQIYGVEEGSAEAGHCVRALVMELVDGETLADRIARGPIPIAEALPIARQIAEALEAAHAQGIIHRDLKPANIKVRADGTVKVLDFGLAKLAASVGPAAGSATLSPTITSPALMTGVGMLLGTAAYMSPEQAKGKEADKRSDVWAFGCLLYEMLAGRRAFGGEDVADTLANVLKIEPDWSAIPAAVPASVTAIIRGCLDKDRHRRVADIAAAKFVLRDPSLGSATAAVSRSTAVPQRNWHRVLWIVPAVAVALTLGVVVGRSTRPAPSPSQVTRYAYSLPPDQRFTEVGGQVVTISRTGSHIAYIANRRVYLKPLSELDARPVSGTEASAAERLAGLMFSPDGQSLGFWLGNINTGTMKQVPLGGGAPVSLASLSSLGSLLTQWREDGFLVGEAGTGIVRVAPDGRREVLIKRTDGMIAAPQILPDGDTVLYAVTPGTMEPTGAAPDTWDKARIIAHSLKSGEEKTLLEGGAPMYVPTGHLVYAVGGTLFAVPFDYRRRQLTRGPVSVVEGVARPVFTNAAPPTVYYGVSQTGTLVYVPGPASLTTGQFGLALVSADGHVDPLKLPVGSYLFPRASFDGKRIAYETEDEKGTNVWIYELSGTSAPRQLTLQGKNRYPVWSADAARVAYQSDREGDLAIYAQAADGSAPAERLTRPAPGVAHIPESWSPDGRTLLYSQSKGGRDFELWGLSLPEKKPFRFGDVRSTADPPSAMFSPDGKWIVYLSTAADETRTVFVEPFPSTGVKQRIGTGLWHPVWSADGKRLFYRGSGAREYVVQVTTQPSFAVSNPATLASTPFQSRGRVEREYDLMKDGRFIGVAAASQGSGEAASPFGTAQQINVIVNWFDELKQRVPTK